MLEPTVQRMIQGAYRRGHGALHLKSIAQVRQYFHQFSQPSPYSGYHDYKVNKLKLRVHRINETTQALPLLIYLRASAYMFGGIEDADLLCYTLAKNLNCVVVAIEPRLAPEVKFPIPFTDCLAGIYYLLENHRQLNINIKNIAIWGESSGGNLAAGICAHFSKEKEQVIKSQVLFYPMLDYSQQHIYLSKSLYGHGFMLDTALTDWFLNHYVSSKQDFEDERVSPLLAQNFTNLPATLVIGAQCDPMRDEATCYVQKLLQAKVTVQSLFIPGLTHGFLWYSNRVDRARYPLFYAANFLKEQFNN
ncbi:MAG: alpha/beta hydrolase [Proteobacteria bacterium]|nr:alpha/beta hydrolase [Pseudomonadota bacterium]